MQYIAEKMTKFAGAALSLFVLAESGFAPIGFFV